MKIENTGALQLHYLSRTVLREEHKLKVNQLVHITLHSILEEAIDC